MSSQYTTEPPPTATVLIHTTAGPLTVSLFAQQAPLTCRNFLQHCLDGYYENNIFHRVSAGFVIQTGDPTGTGEGGQNIYEDRENEKLDADWAKILRTDEGEPVKFGDEIHSRLRFNRRGLVGMAKGTGEGGNYGSQFFITLGDCRVQLDGNCTMFGRVEGDGIYNIVKIAEGELLEGTERPMYPEKILKIEVIELPKQDAWQKMKKRERTATRTSELAHPAKKKAPKKKAGKALLSFGGDEGEEEEETTVVKPKKAKVNTTLFGDAPKTEQAYTSNGTSQRSLSVAKPLQAVKSNRSPSPSAPQKRKADPIQASSSPQPKRHRPSFHDPMTQLPLRNPEIPSRSPSPPPPRSPSPPPRRRSSTSKHTSTSEPSLQSQINALKASMRRSETTDLNQSTKKLSAIDAMIPATSIRGRRKPQPGNPNDKESAASLSILDAFRARLEKASTLPDSQLNSKSSPSSKPSNNKPISNSNGKFSSHNEDREDADNDDDTEAHLCDLHFIANCQSCFDLDSSSRQDQEQDDADDRAALMTHALTFEKDRLGKDLTWKKKNEEELVVIDPRERERELGIGGKKDRDKGKRGHGGDGFSGRREWDRDRERDSDKDRNRGVAKNAIVK